jgi:hypothetical protein
MLLPFSFWHNDFLLISKVVQMQTSGGLRVAALLV